MPSAATGPEARRIGEYLTVPPSAIEWAISVQSAELASGNVKPIGEILIEREQITRADLLDALERQRLDRLRQCPLFTRLPDADLASIGARSEEITLAAGQELLRQDQRGDSIYTLVSGRLLIYRSLEHLEGIPVGVAIPGDFLGEDEYFSNGARSLSACAIEPSLLLRTRYDVLPERSVISPGYAHANAFSLTAEAMLADFCLEWNGTAASVEDETRTLQGIIVRRACQAMDADSANLFLMDGDRGGLFTIVFKGEESRTFRVPVGAGIAGFAARTGELVTVTEAYLDARFNPEIDVWNGYWTRTILAGPIRDREGGVIGVIQVQNKKNGFFNRDDEVLCRAFAHQVANAVMRYRRAFDSGPREQP